MKTVVFITGTNCSGKTSLARALIERFGGVAREEEPEEGVVYSVMKDRRVCFAGLYKLTFRTPIVESAQDFWLHMGARIVDVKGEDYEMELNIE